MKNIQNVLQENPPLGLYEAIVSHIDFEKVRLAKRKFYTLITGMVASSIVFMTTFWYAMQQFAKSEFPYYFSLIFSEGIGIFKFWKEFFYALIESIPVLSVIILLTTFCIVLILLKNIAKSFSKIPYSSVHA